ncbi:poly-beta-1,6-N-acetyl-D-glucosamine biosynthesis protein PgaD [Geoalkalibacter halelectricus]|uniref:Poly-beta-1,6-N-acetyl-D-glucosamine biosynthesis protein PgaD n=1 Tax=Geoalkalibacter halelectricus TaxID=2847045 RepID=A0ABY5ZKY9_9BACT|nr:poly-beta-1,6-N-acetyl-D-glucosamine biosynthesis protein PgaD [Geoalkalibacter halelectricus]MDO3378870.1 poly-beta-1,6-N-acetyl-D-glucosamine biosynthesis protein PgaD [Geoalkalibacter halelectricus]UWZ79827.1 poly-beta-1,6-N-acetyl-D-glucosamine biosynthesis protein PgaD [Geoalkalibacter halelectricus]
MKPPIIENPRGATRTQRYGQGLLTAVFWVILVLLLRPLLTLGAWLVGGHLLFQTLGQSGGLSGIFRVPFVYLLVVALIGVVLIGWATYNLLRFRNNERRTRQPDPVTAAQLAGFFGVAEAKVRHWQGSRRIVMSHDELGRPGEG